MSISPSSCRLSHELARRLLLAVLHLQPRSCSRSSSPKPKKAAAGQESSRLLLVVVVRGGVGKIEEESRSKTRSGRNRNGDARN